MRFISKKINLLEFHIVFSERNPNSIQIQALNPDPEIDHCMAYFIENFIVIQRELKNGKSYEQAIKIADEKEEKERNKSKFLQKIKKIKDKEKQLKKVYKKKIFASYCKKIMLLTATPVINNCAEIINLMKLNIYLNFER